ncbi:antirestriction protein [Klebsiella sp. PL-2018]
MALHSSAGRWRLHDAQLWNHITFHPECNAIYAALD